MTWRCYKIVWRIKGSRIHPQVCPDLSSVHLQHFCTRSVVDCFCTSIGNCSIVVGRYYLADSGYMDQQGYMTPFWDTRYHKKHFKGIDVRTLDRHEKFNYIHSKLRNIIERRFGHLKERWHILEGVPFFRREKQAWIIISCFAMENYLWLRQYGDGSTYDPSEWVAMNTTTNTSELRELVSAAVWPA